MVSFFFSLLTYLMCSTYMLLAIYKKLVNDSAMASFSHYGGIFSKMNICKSLHNVIGNELRFSVALVGVFLIRFCYSS